MAVLTDLASLKRAFYRLTATSPDDGALTEHDDVGEEAVEMYLQYGAYDAQEFLVNAGSGDRWVSTSSTLSFSGSDAQDAGRYTTLPTDFWRAAGSEDRSALRRPNGQRWGQEIPWEHRHDGYRNAYYFQNGRLWITPGSAPPTDLVMDYHHRLADLADDTTVDFPVEDRDLIVAYGADRAATDGWVPEDSIIQKIKMRLSDRKKAALRRARRTKTPRRMRTIDSIGSHWMGA